MTKQIGILDDQSHFQDNVREILSRKEPTSKNTSDKKRLGIPKPSL